MEEFDDDFKDDYVEMHIDEMKAVKRRWDGFLDMAQTNLDHIYCIEETKENRWELKSLEMDYTYFIDQIKKVIKIYRGLINKAEDCELDEEEFKKAMKKLQLIGKDLRIESSKKSFKTLNMKYIEGLREAKDITV